MGGAFEKIGSEIKNFSESNVGRVLSGGLIGAGGVPQGMQGMGGGSGIQVMQPPTIQIPQANPNAYKNGEQGQEDKPNIYDPNAAIYGSGIISPARKRFPGATY